MKFRKPRFSLAAKFSLFIPLPIVVAALALSSSFINHDLMQIKAALYEIIDRYTNEKDLLYIVIRNISEKVLAGYSAELGNMSTNTITNIPHVTKPVKFDEFAEKIKIIGLYWELISSLP